MEFKVVPSLRIHNLSHTNAYYIRSNGVDTFLKTFEQSNQMNKEKDKIFLWEENVYSQKDKILEILLLVKDRGGQEPLQGTGSSDREIKRQDQAKKHLPERWKEDCKDAHSLLCQKDRFGQDDCQDEATYLTV